MSFCKAAVGKQWMVRSILSICHFLTKSFVRLRTSELTDGMKALDMLSMLYFHRRCAGDFESVPTSSTSIISGEEQIDTVLTDVALVQSDVIPWDCWLS